MIIIQKNFGIKGHICINNTHALHMNTCMRKKLPLHQIIQRVNEINLSKSIRVERGVLMRAHKLRK